MLITNAGNKGGSAKTTTTISAAVELASRGNSVLCIDADPEKQLSEWAELRNVLIEEGENIPRITVRTCSDVYDYVQLIEKYEDAYDYILTDLPGVDAGLNRQAIAKSNICIIPVLNSGFDQRRLPKISQMIGAAKELNPYLQAYVLPCQISTHHARVEPQLQRIRDRLSYYENLQEFPAYTHTRGAYSDCTHDGFAPQEWGDPKAAREIKYFVDQLLATEEKLADALEQAGVL